MDQALHEPRILQHPSVRAERPDSHLTLRECYERFVMPLQADAAPGTFADYRGTLNRWERALGRVAVGEVDEETIAAFRRSLERGRISKATVAKHLKNVRRVLRVCGPAHTYYNPWGRGAVERVPFVAVPKVGRRDRVKRVRVLSLDARDRWYRGCLSARWPNGVAPAPLIAQTLFVLIDTYGLDPGDCFRLEWRSGVRFEPECPNRDLESAPGVPFRHPWGWLAYTREKTDVDLDLPLTPAAHAHLAKLREFTGRGRRVFPVPTRPNSWVEARRRVQRAAGIDEPYTFHEVRKTANTNWRRVDADLGPAVLGHRVSGVNEEYYTNQVPKLCDRLGDYPQPPSVLARVASTLAGRLPRLID